MQLAVSISMLIAWLQPMHILPWTSWHSEVPAFVGIASVFAYIQWKDGCFHNRIWHIPYAAIGMSVIVLIVWCQWWLGQISFIGDVVVLTLYAATSAMAVSIGRYWAIGPAEQLAMSRTSLLVCFARVVVIASIISVLIALAQSLNIWNSINLINRFGGYHRPGANFGQANHFGTLLMIGVASLMYLFEEKRVGLLNFILFQIILIFGLVLAESRTAYIGFTLLTAWWLAKRTVIASRISPFVMVLMWVALLLLASCWPSWITSYHFPNESDEMVAPLKTTVGVRWIVWPQLLEAAIMHPWAGWGVKELTKAHNAVLHLYEYSAPFSYAHNFILDMIIGIGFPAAIIATTVLSIWVFSRVRAVETHLSWYCLAICLPIGVHSMFEFPFAYSYFLFPLMLSVGVIDAELKPRNYFSVSIWFARGFSLIFIFAMGVCFVDYVRVEEDFTVARLEASHVGRTASDYRKPNILFLTQMDAMLAVVRMVPGPKMTNDDIETLRLTALRFPWTAIQNRYAMSLALNGNQREAQRQLLVIRAMHGAELYKEIRAKWVMLSQSEFPELVTMNLP
jgi:hypothetical protein